MIDLSTAGHEAPTLVAGRYAVLGLLGAGGMGTVYRVRDLELDEVVALKLLKRELTRDPDAIARFRREVKLARRVTHRNVTRTFDLGDYRGVPFLTMELVEGISLGDELSRVRRLPVRRALFLATEIAAGLAAAHEVAIVHGDLKPDNVLLASDGRVVVSDFGVARAFDSAERGPAMGTPAYMAPEQLQTPDDVDGRADVYALGIVLYELLTGELPWVARNLYGLVAARLTTPPRHPRTLVPELPSAVCELVLACLARDRSARVESALALHGALLALSPDSRPVPSISPPARPAAAPLRVAVLRFRHEGAGDDRYLTLGLTEAVADELARVRSLRVRTSSQRSDEVDGAALGRSLGVDAVVEGSCEVEVGRMRVAARVVGADDGFLLGSVRLEGARGEVPRLASQVASAVAEALERGHVERRTGAGPSAEAVDLYLRGRWEYHRFWRPDEAATLLARAHALAGEDPRILAALALARSREVGLEVDTRQARADARAFAARAVELAPELADAHVAVGVTALRDGNVEAAAHAIRAAHDLDPGNVDALEQSARILLETSSAEEGIARAELAMRAEPVLAATLPFHIVRAHALLGEWDVVDRAFATRPREDGARTTYWLTRARLSMWREGTREAARVLAELEADPIPNATFPMGFARVAIDGSFGPTERAFLLERAQSAKTSPRQRSFFAQVTAEVLCRIGEWDGALAFVDAAVADGLFDLLWLDGCPVIEPLRSLPRWRALRDVVWQRASKAAAILLSRRSLLPTVGLAS